MGIPVYHNITLDMLRPNSEIVWAMQNDRLSRKIVAKLTAGGVAWTPPGSTLTAILRYRKPDGTGGYYDLDEQGNPAVVVDGSTVTLTLVEQALTVPGVVAYELDWYNNARRLTSFTFLINVEPSVISDATIISSNYFNALTARVTEASADIEAAMALFSTARMHAPNLLDNGWFTVNQRGVTDLATNGYKVDRWMAYRATGSIGDSGITMSAGSFYQKLEPTLWTSLVGKPLTASVLLSDGTVHTASISSFSGNTSSFPGGKFLLGADNKTFELFTQATIRAAKLEVGLVSTLANDAPPNYADELRKCQRYFYRLATRDGRCAALLDGYSYTTSQARLTAFFPAPMRTAPTVSCDSWPTLYVGDAAGKNIQLTDSSQVSTLVAFGDDAAGTNCQGILLLVSLTDAGLVRYAPCLLRSNGTVNIDFSADL